MFVLFLATDFELLVGLRFSERRRLHHGRLRTAKNRLFGAGSDGVRLEEAGQTLLELTCLPAGLGGSLPA